MAVPYSERGSCYAVNRMPENKMITRRRALSGLVTVGIAGAAAGVGTTAYFSDSETSPGNAIQAGTLALGFDSSGSFTYNTDLAPGESTTDSVTLVNDGTMEGSLDVSVGYVEDDGETGSHDVSAQRVAQNLEVRTLTYGTADVTSQIDSGSPPTLDDLASNEGQTGEATGNDLVDLADPGNGREFAVGLRLKDVGNDFQGDGIAITFDFHLNQNDEQ